MPPPVASGLLWSTDSAIEFARTGAAVPAIPVARGAGPLYVVISYSQAATPGEDEPAIFYIGNPSDNLYTTNIFHVYRNYGTGIGVATTPGRGMMVDLPAPPSDFVGEFWTSSTGSNMVSYLNPGWYMDPIPNHDPVATSHLFIGYKPDGANAAWRGAGTIKRMAIYNRIPTTAERAQLVEWVQQQGVPAVEGSLASASKKSIAGFSASVSWPAISADFSAASLPSVSNFAAAAQWPAISADFSAASRPSVANFAADARWPAISGTMDAFGVPSFPSGQGDVGNAAAINAHSAASLVSFSASVEWAQIEAALAIIGSSSVAGGDGIVGIDASLDANNSPSSFHAEGHSAWPGISAGMAAFSAASDYDGFAVISVAGAGETHSPPSIVLIWAGSGWVPISASMGADSKPSIAGIEASLGNYSILAAEGLQSNVDISAIVGWPAVLGHLSLVGPRGSFGASAKSRINATVEASSLNWSLRVNADVDLLAALTAHGMPSEIEITEGRHAISGRYSFPGPRPAGNLLQPSRPGGGLIDNERSRGQLIEVR